MLDLLYKRRSIRKYQDKKVEKEKLDKILEAALLSPSSRGRRPWEFIVVDNKELIHKLSKSKLHGSAFLENAPLAIVILANDEITDVWVEDTSIAATIIQLQAESLGLGSCWVQIRNRLHNEEQSSDKYISSTFNLPKNIKVEAIIGIGYSDEKKDTYKKEDLIYDKISYNEYR